MATFEKQQDYTGLAALQGPGSSEFYHFKSNPHSKRSQFQNAFAVHMTVVVSWKAARVRRTPHPPRPPCVETQPQACPSTPILPFMGANSAAPGFDGSFITLTRYSSCRPLCRGITDSFQWKGGSVCFSLIYLSVRPSAVMSARPLPPRFLACSLSVLMPHQVVMAFHFLQHSFLHLLRAFFFFSFFFPKRALTAL